MTSGRYELNKNLAQMLKGGVIMDVTTPEQAQIAEEAGAAAVMALERIPADIRAAGGVSRMSDPKMIMGIQKAVSIPVMAKCRIGHFVEAQILQAIDIDYIDESEVLSPADDKYHIDKTKFDVPFVCGARDLGEALRRINEGASMIRTKGEPGTGDVVQAVRHLRMMQSEIKRIGSMAEDELFEAAKALQVPYDLVKYVHEHKKLPVVNFAAGGVATPADAALMMQLGAEGVFVGSGIFKSGNPRKRAAAIVKAVTNFRDAKMIAELKALDNCKGYKQSPIPVKERKATGHTALYSNSLDGLIAQIYTQHSSIGFTTGGHTGEDVYLAAYHPTGTPPRGMITNVELNHYMAALFGMAPDSLSRMSNTYFAPHTAVFRDYECRIEPAAEGEAAF